MLVLRLCIALVLALAGCSYPSGGEVSASQCNDAEDNDGDRLNNCDDPDCQAFDHCRAPVGSPPLDAGPPTPSDDANTGAPHDAGSVGDAAVDTDAAIDEDDGGTVDPPEPVDAGTPPCGGRCTVTQACMDEVCEDVSSPTAGTFDLRILAAPVPAFNRWGMCLDACPDSRFATFAFCACDPDPYVEVSRVRQDGQQQMRTLLGSTPVRLNEVRPTYEDTLIRVELTEGDALWFVVFDEDPGTGDNTAIYSCLPDLRELAPGLIECSDTVVPFLPAYTIRAELVQVP
jgi:hypothetical protein